MVGVFTMRRTGREAQKRTGTVRNRIDVVDSILDDSGHVRRTERELSATGVSN